MVPTACRTDIKGSRVARDQSRAAAVFEAHIAVVGQTSKLVEAATPGAHNECRAPGAVSVGGRWPGKTTAGALGEYVTVTVTGSRLSGGNMKKERSDRISFRRNQDGDMPYDPPSTERPGLDRRSTVVRSPFSRLKQAARSLLAKSTSGTSRLPGLHWSPSDAL